MNSCRGLNSKISSNTVTRCNHGDALQQEQAAPVFQAKAVELCGQGTAQRQDKQAPTLAAPSPACGSRHFRDVATLGRAHKN